MTAAAPLKYQPDFETPEIGEEKSIAALIKTMHGINETTSKNYGHAVRASFAKSFALLDAELTVLSDLSPELAQGLFAQAAVYPVTMRMSTAPGDVLPDNISTARGLALKVSDVKGKRLPGSEAHTTQDFIFVDAPFFFNSNLATLLQSLAAFGATTDKLEGTKKVISTVMRGVETAMESVGLESSLVKHAGGQLPVHPLGDTYNTQAPILYGPYMAKLRLVPLSPEVRALMNQKIELSDDHPDLLREETIEFFAKNSAEFELQVQLSVDAKKMPLEDPSMEWPEKLSPFIAVARLRIPPQVAWSEDKSKSIDDGMSFNPWHSLAAHRPLGAIMRGRKAVYPTSAEFRAKFNGCPMQF